MRTIRTMWLVSVVLGALALVPTERPAGAGDRDTHVVMTGITGTIDVTPGLCMPGAEAFGCTNAPEDQFRLRILTCSATGRFEGVELTAGAPCPADFSGFMEGVVKGLDPSCLTSHTYSSDEATAFGPPVNRVAVGEVSRKASAEYPPVARLGGIVVATGAVDDDDPDDDPKGDHTLVVELFARPDGFPRACGETPATRVVIQAGAGEIVGGPESAGASPTTTTTAGSAPREPDPPGHERDQGARGGDEARTASSQGLDAGGEGSLRHTRPAPTVVSTPPHTPPPPSDEPDGAKVDALLTRKATSGPPRPLTNAAGVAAVSAGGLLAFVLAGRARSRRRRGTAPGAEAA